MQVSEELKAFVSSIASSLFRAAIETLTSFKTSEPGRRKSLAQMCALLSLLHQEIPLPVFADLLQAFSLVCHKYKDDAALIPAVMSCARGLGAALPLDDRLHVVGKLMETRRVSDAVLFGLTAELLCSPAACVLNSRAILQNFLLLINTINYENCSSEDAQAAARALTQLLLQESLSLTGEEDADLTLEVLETAISLAHHAPVPVLPFVQLAALRAGRNAQQLLEQVGERLLGKLQTAYDKGVVNRNNFRLLVSEILPRVPSVAAKFFPLILSVAGSIADEEDDARARFSALEAAHSLLTPELAPEVRQHSAQFIEQVVAKGLKWHAGRATAEVRKAALLCLFAALRLKALSPSALTQAGDTLVPLLHGCLNDDWAPELRLQACTVLGELLCATELRGPALQNACTALIERLDDAQDAVRAAAATTLSQALAGDYGASIPAETQVQAVKTLFVHLDDSNIDVQQAVYECLLAAAGLQRGKVVEAATAALATFRAPAVPQRLLAALAEGNS